MTKNKKVGTTIKNIKGNVIYSVGQSGGVTAHTVNNTDNQPSQKKQWWNKTWFQVAALLSVIFTTLSYFGLQPHFETKKEKPIIDSSTNKTTERTPKVDTLLKTPLLNKTKPNHRMFNKKDEKKPLEISNITGDVVVSQNQTGGITAHTVNITSQSYTDLKPNIKTAISDNLAKLFQSQQQLPIIYINVEAGNSMRTKIALEFEGILNKYNAGVYPRGNTFMGVSPDYPVTITLNPINKNYISQFLKIVQPFIKSDFHFQYNEAFPANAIKFYINGEPTFDENGAVTII
jgi:hypothetical protein